VIPVAAGARRGRPYHPLFVPPATGTARIDNPDRYRVLYLSGSAAGAVAEAFGRFARWGPFLLDHPAGHRRRVVTYELAEPAAVLDLDDARALLDRRLRPSDVVTRERTVTQRWAAAVHDEARWSGVRWWSYYDPRWSSVGLWATEALTVVEVAEIEGSAGLEEAAAVLLRTWV
jgi:hypothetical protein